LEIRSFDFVKGVFDERIRTIVDGAGATDYILYLTADKRTHKIAKRSGLLAGEFLPNFREGIAAAKAYKGTRKQDKPFHWINLTAYILSLPGVRISIGHEADDEIAIAATEKPDASIICTRDKDLGLPYGLVRSSHSS